MEPRDRPKETDKAKEEPEQAAEEPLPIVIIVIVNTSNIIALIIALLIVIVRGLHRKMRAALDEDAPAPAKAPRAFELRLLAVIALWFQCGALTGIIWHCVV